MNSYIVNILDLMKKITHDLTNQKNINYTVAYKKLFFYY